MVMPHPFSVVALEQHGFPTIYALYILYFPAVKHRQGAPPSASHDERVGVTLSPFLQIQSEPSLDARGWGGAAQPCPIPLDSSQ